MNDYRDDICRLPDQLAGPTHPIISHHQNLRVQRFSNNSPRAAAPAETIGDRVLVLERAVHELENEIKKLKETQHVHD